MDLSKNHLEYYKFLQGLKTVNRYKPFKGLQEKVAGHVYMTIMLANDIMDNYNLNLNKDLVLKLLMYHDLAEIGMSYDFPADVTSRSEDSKKQKKALEIAKIDNMSKQFKRPQIKTLFDNFDNLQTREALFANLVDKLEASIHILTNKCAGFKCNDDYEFILHYAERYISHFPELKPLLNTMVKELNKFYTNFKKKNQAKQKTAFFRLFFIYCVYYSATFADFLFLTKYKTDKVVPATPTSVIILKTTVKATAPPAVALYVKPSASLPPDTVNALTFITCSLFHNSSHCSLFALASSIIASNSSCVISF